MNSIIKHSLGKEGTDEAVKKAAAERHAEPLPIELSTKSMILTKEFRNLSPTFDDEDGDDLEAELAEQRKQAAQNKIKAEIRSTTLATIQSGSRGSSSAFTSASCAGGPALAPRQRTFAPSPRSEGYAQFQGQQWCPPGNVIHKDRTENRWRINAP